MRRHRPSPVYRVAQQQSLHLAVAQEIAAGGERVETGAAAVMEGGEARVFELGARILEEGADDLRIGIERHRFRRPEFDRWTLSA